MFLRSYEYARVIRNANSPWYEPLFTADVELLRLESESRQVQRDIKCMLDVAGTAKLCKYPIFAGK